MIGLSFDIVGGLLVAVEAVKLENIRRLRDRLLVPAQRSLRPVRIEWIEERGYYEHREDWFGRRVLGSWLPWLVFHGLLAAVPLVLIGLVFRAFGISPFTDAVHVYRGWFVDGAWWLKALLVLGAAYLALLVLVVLGEPGHQALIRLVGLAVRALKAIERNTPNGTIGIIGALCLMVGFSLQVVGAVTSASH